MNIEIKPNIIQSCGRQWLGGPPMPAKPRTWRERLGESASYWGERLVVYSWAAAIILWCAAEVFAAYMEVVHGVRIPR